MRSRCRRGVLIRARIQIPRSQGRSAGDISHIDFPRSRGWAGLGDMAMTPGTMTGAMVLWY